MVSHRDLLLGLGSTSGTPGSGAAPSSDPALMYLLIFCIFWSFLSSTLKKPGANQDSHV